MDWITTIIVALVGPVSAFGAAVFVERGQTRRALRAEATETVLRQEIKADERWEQAKPNALKVLETLANARRLARPTLLVEHSERRTPFDESFPAWWANALPDLEVNSAMIPSDEYREWLTTAIDGISDAQHMVERTSFGNSYPLAVATIAEVGVSVIASWLRHDASPDADALAGVDDIADAMTDLYQQFEEEAADQDAFERSQRSSLGR